MIVNERIDHNKYLHVEHREQSSLFVYYLLPQSDLNLNSLLVKRQTDTPSPGAVTGGN